MALKLSRSFTRSVGRLLTLVVIALLAALFRYLGPEPGIAGNTMLLGFLLLAAFVTGELAREVNLPRITGYLIIGVLFGPHILGLVPMQTVEDFRLINGVALSVIALQAGGELRVWRLANRLRAIVAITAAQIGVIVLGTAVIVYLARDTLPFLAGQPGRATVAVALIFGLVAVAKSPATTIAVITEMRARGPLTDTVLGVSILKDVVILLMVAAVLPAAAVLVDPTRGFDYRELVEITLVIVLSLALGGLLGAVIGIYLKRVNVQPILFVLGMAFIMVELAHALGLKDEGYILMGIASGFVVQNFSVQGPKFIEALEANSLPLYALFFAVAGAELALGTLPAVWKAGLLLFVSRLALIYVSTNLGAMAEHDSPSIRRYAWMGFLAQAGVTLGIAGIVRERFPEWGDPVAAIIIAMVALNQLVGPPLFRLALVRSAEGRS